MEQQIQPKPVVGQKQPIQEQQTKKPALEMPKKPATVQTSSAEKQDQPVVEKKSKWWLWLIIALAIVCIGAVVYLFLF